MRGVRAWFVRLGAALRPGRRDRELADELNGHLELAIEEHVRAGLPPDKARRRALLDLGGIVRANESCRERRGVASIEALGRDIRYTTRSMLRSPLFTLVSVMSLAIAIAGNATIFSLVDTLLLRDRPGITQRGTLVDVGETRSRKGFDSFSYPNYLDYRDRLTAFEQFAAYRDGEAFGLSTGGGAVRVHGGQVSDNYFPTVQVPMALGPGFQPTAGGNPGVVLSHRLWQSQFHADGSVIGVIVRMNGEPYEIVGVAADGFAGSGMYAEDLWIQITSYPEGGRRDLLTQRSGGWLRGIARLKAGVSIAQANSQAVQVAGDLERDYPETNHLVGLVVSPSHWLPPPIRPMVGAFVAILAVLVGFILVIACTNVSGMLLARGAGRIRELSVRVALGARRAQVVRLLLIDSVLLATVACVAGLAAAAILIRILTALVPPEPYPTALVFQLDWRVVTFSIALSVLISLAVGLVPAMHISRGNLASSMKLDGSAWSPSRLRLRQSFVIVQTALSVLLVISALLLVRSLQHAYGIDPGFSTENVEIAGIDPALAGYDAAAGLDFVERLANEAQRLPMVRSAALTRVVPLTASGYALANLRVPGQADPRDAVADWNLVTPGYFDALSTPLSQGRRFSDSDRMGAPEVAIVNQTMADRTWPNTSAIGQTLEYGSEKAGWRTLHIVGVVPDGKYRTLGESARGFVYVPLRQHYAPHELWLLVRTDGRAVAPALRTLVRQMDPDMPFTLVTELSNVTGVYLLPHRIATWLAGAVAIVGLLLAALGIYGITAYTVSHRTREIGVRVALGARDGEVLRLVTRQGALIAALGMLMGLAAAVVVTRLLSSLLYGIAPLDAISFGGGAALLILVVGIANLIPARRALRLNPLSALRYE